MDVGASVAVGDVEAAVGGKGDVRRVERLVLPLAVLVDASLARRSLGPEDLALEGPLLEDLAIDVTAVEELIGALLADLDPVPAALELFSPGGDELAVLVEDGDAVGRLAGRVDGVDDVGPMLGIEADAVGVAPLELGGQLAPIVVGLIGVLTLAQDRLLDAGLVRRVDQRGGDGNAGPGPDHFDKIPPRWILRSFLHGQTPR